MLILENPAHYSPHIHFVTQNWVAGVGAESQETSDSVAFAVIVVVFAVVVDFHIAIQIILCCG